MNILVVCKYNRFRSKIAEAFFKKYKNCNVQSAGIIKGPPISEKLHQQAAHFGIKLKKTIKAIEWSFLLWQDVIIIVANDVPKEIFDGISFVKDLRVWGVPDPPVDETESRMSVIKMIEENVKNFKISDLE